MEEFKMKLRPGIRRNSKDFQNRHPVYHTIEFYRDRWDSEWNDFIREFCRRGDYAHRVERESRGTKVSYFFADDQDAILFKMRFV